MSSASPALRVADLYPDRPELFSALLYRFWRNVEERGPDECWPWTGCRTTAGYGRTRVEGRRGREIAAYAHRLAFLFCRDDIAEGLVIRHSCDNPPCCNPSHLLSGTQADNIADRVARGRSRGGSGRSDRCPRGEDHPKAKLTWELVRELRVLHAAGGVTLAQLSELYGVSITTVYNVVSGRTWREDEEAA